MRELGGLGLEGVGCLGRGFVLEGVGVSEGVGVLESEVFEGSWAKSCSTAVVTVILSSDGLGGGQGVCPRGDTR